MVVVDQLVRFDAFAHMSGGTDKQTCKVTGRVYGVNYAHKIFHVTYYLGDVEQRTSFKFCEIGDKVRVV